MIAFPSFVLADLLVLVGSLAATSALAPGGRLDRTLAVLTVAIAQIVVSMLIAGALLSELNRAAVLVANAAIAMLLVALATWRHGGRLPLPRLPASSAIWSNVSQVPALIRRHPWCSAIVALAGAELLWRALLVYLLPPYAFDALWYHLTSVGGWLQNGAIGLSPFDGPSNPYPANGELAFAWVALFLRSDTWVNGVQLVFALTGSLAVAGIARTAGLSRASAIAAGALFFLTPTVLTQVTTNYVDVMFASTFLLSLHFLFRYMAGPSPGDLSARTPLVRAEGEAGAGSTILLAGLAAGLAFGMKRTGLVYCGVAVIALGVNLALRRRGGLLSWGGLTARLAVFLIPLVVVGSYWYARNWVHYGNPVYPSHVHLLGHEVFGNPPAPGAIYLGEAGPQPSLIQSLLGQHVVEGSEETGAIHVGEASAQPWFVHTSLSWWHDVAPWTHPEDYYRADQRSGGLGAPYTLLELPALLALAIVSLRRDRRLLNLLVPVAVMFLIQPDKWWSRHTLILAALGAVALLYVAERWAHRWAGRAIRVAIFPALAITLWFSTAAFELGGGFENMGPPLFWAPKVVTLIRNTDERNLDRVLHMPAYGFLPGVPPGSGIGVDTSATFFYSPFYGSYYSNRVYALSEPGAPTLPETVFANRIRYLFLRRGSSLDRRARADLPGLRTLFEDRYVRVYTLG